MAHSQSECLRKAESVFSVDSINPSDVNDMSALFKQLEKLMLNETKVWWDQTTLSNYMHKNMIPRGLRIKKIPTTIYSEEFVVNWNQLLSDCSLNLMRLIIKHEESKLSELQKEIEATHNKLEQYKINPDYQTYNDRIQQAVSRLETTIMTRKKSKFQRDQMDYSQQQVYDWGGKMRILKVPVREDVLLFLMGLEMSPDKHNNFYYYEVYANIIQKMSLTIFSIVFALGIIGNGLVIWIAGFRVKNTINAVWFLNLAIADFLCCASLPLRIADWATIFSLLSSLPDFAFCIVNLFLFTLNMSSSVLLMIIDHCVSLVCPFWAKVLRTYKLVSITAAIIWGLSLIATSLVYYIYRCHLHNLKEWCIFGDYTYLYKQELYQTIQVIKLIIMFVIPFLIIVTSYVTIFYKLRNSKKSQRSFGIITAVILCFFIFSFPYYIWPLTPWHYRKDSLFYILHTIFTSLAFLYSCLNPIIYIFMGLDFQQGFFRSIPNRLEIALSEHPNDLSGEQEDIGNIRTSTK
ncbi:formyl peptide receptor 2-like [Phyllobates terribilis]|uniref:formyl peptide receptor 2-like n=1 Tax=Phyllobates terribilis TaxID=111132 RepID=UPI003CCAC012